MENCNATAQEQTDYMIYKRKKIANNYSEKLNKNSSREMK